MVGHDMLREFRDFTEEFGIRATGVCARSVLEGRLSGERVELVQIPGVVHASLKNHVSPVRFSRRHRVSFLTPCEKRRASALTSEGHGPLVYVRS